MLDKEATKSPPCLKIPNSNNVFDKAFKVLRKPTV